MLTTRNLTIMFTDIVGYTACATSRSRAEHVALLHRHDRALHPLIRQHGGTLIKSMGDGLLVSFASATMALRCAMAMQDALAAANDDCPEDDRLHIRIALAAGDVQLENQDVFGEAVSIASRIETITPSGQIYFAASAYLAMNKAEIPAELVASHELKGVPFPVEVYRVVPQGMDGRYQAVDAIATTPPGWRARAAAALGLRGVQAALAAGAIAAGAASAWLLLPPDQPVEPQVTAQAAAVAEPQPAPPAGDASANVDVGLQRIETLLGGGQVDAAQQALSDMLAANQSAAAILLAQGHLAFAENRRETGVDAYRQALELAPELADNKLLADNLVSALGWETRDARALLEQYASPAMVDALAARTAEPGYWGRLHAGAALRAIGKGERVHNLEAALLDLHEAEGCPKRRAAVERLGALKDKRALPALQPLAHMSLLKRLTSDDACLVEAAKAAVAQIN